MKAVIFDLDGTLFDTEKVFWQAWKTVGDKQGLTIDEKFLIELTGTSKEEEERLYLKYPEYADIVEPAISLGRKHLKQIMNDKTDISRKGAKELILYLHQAGYKLAVASNSSLEHVLGMINTFEQDIIDCFDEIVSAHEVKNGKPAPDVFLEAATRLKIRANEIIVVEDTINGLVAAKQAGMKTILIKSVLPLTKEKKQNADYIAENHQEILNLFKNSK